MLTVCLQHRTRSPQTRNQHRIINQQDVKHLRRKDGRVPIELLPSFITPSQSQLLAREVWDR